MNNGDSLNDEKKKYTPKQLAGLTLGALGVVYGDIGTDPLYALKTTLANYSLSTVNIFGVLSLIFWALVIIISIKYLLIILRADNHGEGVSSHSWRSSKDKNKEWLKPFFNFDSHRRRVCSSVMGC